MPRAASCGSWNRSATVFTAAAGTPAAASRGNQVRLEWRANTLSNSRFSAAACSLRAALPAKRGSFTSSRRSSTAHRAANRRSLPAATTISSSAVA